MEQLRLEDIIDSEGDITPIMEGVFPVKAQAMDMELKVELM